MQFTPRQQEALNIEQHICVTAGAGSGKTRVLVGRYLEILHKTDAKPNEIVAITFTEKAAAEMKERIAIELNKGRNTEGIQEQMSVAPISTIHAFCSRILREFPFQAGVPANFGILQGIDQKLLLQKTVQDELKEIATNAADEDRNVLTCLLRRYGSRKQLEEFLSKMVEQREVVERLKREVYGRQETEDVREIWEQRMAAALKLDVDRWLYCLNTVLGVAKGKDVPTVKAHTAQLKTETEKSAALEILREIAPLVTTTRNTIAKLKFLGKGVGTTSIEAEIEFLESASEEVKKYEPLKDDDDFLIDTTRDILHLYTRIERAYRHAKLAQGQLDYPDLQLKLRDLLKNNAEIRERLQARYRYFMVDEYQDINPLQEELVMLLTDNLNVANLFIVGDAKQGIYGFRGADIRVFNQTRKKMEVMQGASIRMEENFRSLRDVVGFVNVFFHSLMDDGNESEFEVAYQQLVQGRPAPAEVSANTPEAQGKIEIILGQKGDDAVNENELIAKRVKSLIAEGFQVWDKDSDKLRRIQYGDIAILIRSRTHLPDIESALLEAKVPYLTTGGIGFYQRQEIYDMWNYLHVLDAAAEGDVSLAAVLRAPFFGISDDELYEISRQKGNNFWEKAEASLQSEPTGNPRLQIAMDCLKRQRELAKRIPVNQLLLTIVNDTGMIGTLATGRQGTQRWANYQKLLDLARNFERDADTPTLTSFIEFLRILIDEDLREGQAPVQLGDKAVNIMTIHAAKGLEFPVVILPGLHRAPRDDSEPFIDEEIGIGFSPRDPNKGYAKTEPSIVTVMKERAKAKTEAEKKRLFYVGATRARDRLILAGSQEASGNRSNMLEWLYTHLDVPNEGSQCLPVELETYLEGITSRNAFHLSIEVFRCLDDIQVEDTKAEEPVSTDMPEPPLHALNPQIIGNSYAVTELANYARCSMRYRLENVLRIPNPKHDASSEEDSYDEADAPAWDGTEMGRAVHSVLSRIERQTDVEKVESLIRGTFRRYRGVSAAAVRKHVNNFLNSELGKTALASAETNRCEQQIHAELGEQHLLVGRLDRLFKDAAGQWQLIDYKTGETSDVAVYHPQMELYAWLVHQRYPEQPEVTVNLFFTAQNRCETLRFSRAELQEIAARWQETIANLQRGTYEKNLSHCQFCPYADADKRCLVSPEDDIS